ncbi:MAG TPA: Ku protein [Pseudonocardiaceae bacterium]|jgi:DNA end-binding protein Ku|nr:Ku protein [Pseudonocardiaceae bacterium]
MRSVWNGTIAFGQVTIPVKAYSATEQRGSGLHQLHVNDGGRIKLRRTCEIDGEDVPFAELGKGFELPDGDVVVLTQEDMSGLPVAASHSIEVCAFTPLDQIDPIHLDRSYYLAPEPAGTKPYVLLGEALRQTGKVAVVRVALRRRETLAMLRERDNVIVLTTLLWPDEIRTPSFPFLDEDVSVRMGELRSAVSDVERLSGDFEPTRYADEYRDALRALVNARVDAGEVVRPTAAAQDEAAAELVATLRESADQAATGSAVDKAKAAVRKAAAAKAAATRAANRAAGRAADRASDARKAPAG